MRVRSWPLVFAVPAAWVAACADLSGLSGSGPDAGGLDAGGPGDATASDAGKDATPPSDARSRDAPSPDAATDGAAVPFACAPAVTGVRCAEVDAAVLCEDFDEPNPLASWQTYQLDPDAGGTVSIDPDASTSSPDSLLAFQQPDPNDRTGVAIHQNLLLGGAQPSRVSISVDLRADQMGAGSIYALDVVFQQVTAGGNAYSLSLFLSQGFVFFAEASSATGHYTNASCFNVLDANWHHYSVAVDFVAGTAWLTLDSYPPCVQPLKYASEVPQPFELGVDVGAPVLDPSGGGPWIVHHDSVVVCAE